MTALTQPQPMTLDEAVAEGVAAAERGAGIALTAESLWHSGLDAEAIDACGPIGLATMIHRVIDGRHGGDGAEEAGTPVENDTALGRPLAIRHYAKERWLRILAGNYESADGTRKQLFDFGPGDLTYLRTLANNRSDGYLKLRDGADAAISLLAKYHKPTIRDLPAKAQQAIAEVLA